MRCGSMWCLFLFSISLFQCYGMEEDKVSKDLSKMEKGLFPKGDNGDRYVDQLELEQFGFDANYIEQIKKQLNNMDPDEFSALDSTKKRGFNQFSPMFQQSQQQQNPGLLDRLFSNQSQGGPNQDYATQLRLMEILSLMKRLHKKANSEHMLLKRLHEKLFLDHTGLKECHTSMEGKLKKKEKCATLHKVAEGFLAVFGIFVGGVITVVLTKVFGL